MRIYEIMTSKPHIINSETSILNAAKTMQKTECGVLPVGNIHNINGIITDRDIIVKAVALEKDIVKTPVKDIMTTKLYFCEEEDFLQEAVYLMNHHKIRRVLVLTKNKILSGIISLGDIIRRVKDSSLLGKLFKETEIA